MTGDEQKANLWAELDAEWECLEEYGRDVDVLTARVNGLETLRTTQTPHMSMALVDDCLADVSAELTSMLTMYCDGLARVRALQTRLLDV